MDRLSHDTAGNPLVITIAQKRRTFNLQKGKLSPNILCFLTAFYTAYSAFPAKMETICPQRA